MIPKNLFLIDIHDEPRRKWLDNVVCAYKEANPDFDVRLLSYSTDDVMDIYAGKKDDKYAPQMLEAISTIKEKLAGDYNGRFDWVYLDRLVDCKKYGWTRTFENENYWVVLLVDIFRFFVLADYGGIYVDTDTFPLKPFDDALLSEPFNCTARTRGIQPDMFFIGREVHTGCGQIPGVAKKWLFPFYQRTTSPLTLDDIANLKYTEDLSSKRYIEHFFFKTWKSGGSNGRRLSGIFE